MPAAIAEAKELIAGRILERMPLGCLISDRNFRFVDWNPEAEKIFGFTRDEAIGRHYFELIVPASEQGQINATFERLILGDMGVRVVVSNITKDGRTITCEWHHTPLFDEAGVFEGLVALVRDVSQQQRDAQELAESKTFLEQAHAIAQFGSWVWELGEEDELRCSDEVLRMFGVTAAELTRGRNGFDLIHPEDIENVRSAIAAAIDADKQYDIVFRIVRTDKSICWVRSRAEVVRDAQGKPLRLIGASQDITLEKAEEEEKLQSAKMEAIGRLAGGVAHDFNNLLTVVMSYGELVRDAMPRHDPRRDDIDEILKAAGHAADLGRQLVSFGRGQLLQTRLLDLNEVIRDIEKMLRRVIGEDILLEVSLEPQLGVVRADPTRVQQVIMNLVVNARDAMPNGGRLTIESANVDLDDERATSHAGLEPGAYVSLSVSDTGCGMTEEIRSRVFEPFFTTKERGRGSGLGLATTYGIVRQSGGTIRVTSEVDRGTTFKIFLPRVTDGIARAPKKREPKRHALRGSETILLVEDERVVRNVAACILRAQGYAVLEASDGIEGEAIAENYVGEISLLVTDVVMPKRGGAELAERLMSKRRNLRVLFISGYGERAALARANKTPQGQLLEKPFSAQSLALKVRAALDDHSTPPIASNGT